MLNYYTYSKALSQEQNKGGVLLGREVKPINRRMAAYRKNAGFTQEQIADMLGMARSNYARIERSGNPSIELLEKLAEIYKIQVERLLKDQVLDFSAPPPSNPILRANDSYLLDTSDLFPITIEEANLLRILRILPQENTDAAMKFINDLYQNRNKKKD